MNLQELSTTREQLLDEISSLSYDQFNRKTEKNKWSIAQVCHHLVITEILFTKAIESGLNQKARTVTERKPIHLVLDRSKKFTAPRVSEPSLEPFQVEQIIDQLSESRRKMLNVLGRVDDANMLKETAVRHLVFGELPLDQWIDLLYMHEQRHIEQIKLTNGTQELR